MKKQSFTYVSNFRELSDYTFVIKNNNNFSFNYQFQENFYIGNDGFIKIIIKSYVFPIEFFNLKEIDKLFIETPTRDLDTGKDILLIKEISDIDAKINYTIDCGGMSNIITLSIKGKLDKQYIKEIKG